jgi:hypothetical protein
MKYISKRSFIKMNHLKSLALALVLFSAVQAGAGLLEYQTYGSNTLSFSAASRALCVRGIARKGETFLANPALATLQKGLSVQATLNADWQREVRSREVFDSYSNSVGMNTESVNSNSYFSPANAVVSYSLNAWGSSGEDSPQMAVSLGAATECDYRYDYRKEERDYFWSLVRTDQVSSKGRILGYSAGLAGRLLPYLSLGLSGTVLDGRHEITTEKIFTDPTVDDSLTSVSQKTTGSHINIGIWSGISPRLALAALYKSGRDFEGENPDELVLGLNYTPANYLPASATMEYSYSAWSKAANPLATGHKLYDVHRYSLGITHKLKDQLPLHFGVSFANSYLSRGIGLAQAGLGTELNVNKLKTQLAFSVGRRSYNLGQALGTSDAVTVAEMTAELMVTFSLR